MNNDILIVRRGDLREQLAAALARYRSNDSVYMDGSHNPTPGERVYADFLARSIHDSEN